MTGSIEDQLLNKLNYSVSIKTLQIMYYFWLDR